MWLGRNRRVSITLYNRTWKISLIVFGRLPQRNIWPAVVVGLTGFAMSGHEQETMLSTNVSVKRRHSISYSTADHCGLRPGPRNLRLVSVLNACSSHHIQDLTEFVLSSTLMAAGICRIIEICFVLHEEHVPNTSSTRKSGQISAFQHLTPFLLIVGG